MAKQNRTILKNYFQTGDKPSQSEYADLIDSQLNLEDTSAQIVKGPLSCSQQIITNDLQGRTNATTRIELGNTNIDFLVNDVDVFQLQTSTSGTGTKMKIDQPVSILNNTVSASLRTTGDAVIGGNITSSGFIFTETNITASGNISASGEGLFNNLNIKSGVSTISKITGSLKIRGGSQFVNTVEIEQGFGGGGASALKLIAGSGNQEPTLHISNSGERESINAQAGDNGLSIVASGSILTLSHITASGNISSSGGTGSFGSLKVDGSSVDFSGLPTSDPGVAGRLYNDSGTIKISL